MPTIQFDLSAFLGWQSVVLCLTIFAITYIVRKLIEILWKGATSKTSTLSLLYTELFLFCLPILVGLFIGFFAKKYPWPSGTGISYSSRGLYGLVCGMFSGMVYNRVRAMIKPGSNTDDPPMDTVSVTQTTTVSATPAVVVPPVVAPENDPEDKSFEPPKV